MPNAKRVAFQLIFCLLISSVTINADDWDDFVGDVVAGVTNATSYTMPTNNKEFFSDDSSTDIEDFGTYDFIIVGGGTAGGVVANRLTEENYTVLVVEAGKEPPAWSGVLGLSTFLYTTEYNWGYNTTSNNNSCLASRNKQCWYPRGKVLGGSSAINAALYIRGNAADFDKWFELGNEGWSYEDVLPYFIKSENAHFNDSIDPDYHGFNGPHVIDHVKDTIGMTQPLLEAFEELGRPIGDYNGQNQTRCSRMQYSISNNTRVSTTTAYIDPARSRTNLKIVLESLVTRVVISDLIATGVEFITKGKRFSAQATKEVIMSAGTLNTPQVLMLSGVGPQAHLEELGIEVIADLPVGQNLQDHSHFPGVFFRTNQSFYNYTLVEDMDLWRQGDRPLTGSFNIETVTFFEPETIGRMDIEVITLAAKQIFANIFQLNDEYTEAYKNINDTSDFVFTIVLLQPFSVGSVTLQSSDPRDFPIIDVNGFSDERDLDIMYKGIQDVLKMFNTTSFQKHGFEQLLIPLPGCDGTYEQLSKDWWYCALRHQTVTIYHPIGTSRMGNDSSTSVVDSNLKVHGIDHLRIVDAGVMPEHVSGHINAATVMIAEKASDIIKQYYSY